MFLRSLRLRGFKSFPDAVEIRLEPGVAVVVGPNGSGKSNIVDAFVWAAGSLSPNELRADRAEDVLFAGSPSRPPADFCSVELVFDNHDRAAPLPYGEVSVVRRHTRGARDEPGEGQYLVNGASVRRADLVELLADVGLGPGLHSVIGQGSVERILASKPTERRALVEDAAGLGGFKRRRHRAELKLERVAAQLERARDLEAEVRARVRPLALQATAAARAEKLAAERDRVRDRIAAAELERVDSRLAELEERRAEAARERRLQDERLGGLLDERRRAEEELEEAASRHERTTAALYRLRSALERVELRRERAAETARTLEDERERRRRAAPDAPGYDETLTAARGWSPSALAHVRPALARLEDAHARRGDAVVAVSQGEVWFAAAPAKEPRVQAAAAALPDLALAAERLARAPEGAAAGAKRFEPALCGRMDARGRRSRELGDELRSLGAREVELRRAASRAAERASAVELEFARLEREREAVLGRLSEGVAREALSDAELAEARAALARLERRLEALGRVNPLAVEEHAQASERLRELVAQREDLERSLGELEHRRAELARTVE